MFRSVPPHPLLARWVRSYCALDDVHTELTAEHRLYPECNVLLAFLHGESYIGLGSDLRRLPRMYVQEFREFPVRLRSCGPTRLVGVELYPWGAIRLLGALAGSTRVGNPCFVPTSVPETFSARMHALLIAHQQDEALHALEEWLLARATQVDLSPTPAITVAERVFESRGRGTVRDLADEAGLSVRQLERQFQAQVGMSPKLLGRLSRFEAAQRQLFESGPLGDARARLQGLSKWTVQPNLTRIAHDLGYADQAHFSREFRAFAEQSPSGFVSETREFLRRQGDVAFVQAERAAVF